MGNQEKRYKNMAKTDNVHKQALPVNDTIFILTQNQKGVIYLFNEQNIF